mgnify:CR=1 FL=1
MKLLGDRNATLIINAVRMTGTFDPREMLPIIIENLYVHEATEIEHFLDWMYLNDCTLGTANYEAVFKAFKTGDNKKYKRLVY